MADELTSAGGTGANAEAGVDANVRATGAGFLNLDVSGEVALEAVRYDSLSGLVPVVVQDASTGHVLMLAYANREALKRTYGTGQAWFWSRSRKSLWRKGETSGNVLRVVEVRMDCDGDSVLYLVNPAGPACHTGEVSCFYRRMTRHGDGEGPEPGDATKGMAAEGTGRAPSESQGSEVTDPERVPSGTAASQRVDELAALWQVVTERWEKRPEGSYTTYLFEQGVDKSAKKVGEEAVEVVLAAKNAIDNPTTGRPELASESADLVYHLMVLWKACGVDPDDVLKALASRR